MKPFRVLCGDIHNHNAHGYGVGSIERSLDVARTHGVMFASISDVIGQVRVASSVDTTR